MAYNFYGWQNCEAVYPLDTKYKSIKNPITLYDMLSNIWCEYSCAPRLRPNWSKDNMTLGQCSITAFLVQDIFGGEVYGIPLPEGGYHCFNNVDGHIFDLASEQFGDKVKDLDYVNVVKQERATHFADQDKFERYQYLWNKLKELYLN